MALAKQHHDKLFEPTLILTPSGAHAQQSWLSREGVSHRVANPKIFATNPELVFVVCVAVFRCLERLEVSTRREEVKKRGPVLALDARWIEIGRLRSTSSEWPKYRPST